MSRNVRFDLPAVRVVDGDFADALKRFDRRWKASRIKKELAFRAENPTRRWAKGKGAQGQRGGGSWLERGFDIC